MKKYILPPLCSAFVIPGLGQIINQELKKGLILLAVVFAIFVGGSIQLAFMLKALLDQGGQGVSPSTDLLTRLHGENFAALWPLMIAFAAVWIYSVLDAFWTGKKLDREHRGVPR